MRLCSPRAFFKLQVLGRNLGDDAAHPLKLRLQARGVSIGRTLAAAVHLLQSLRSGLLRHGAPAVHQSGTDLVLAADLGQRDAGLLRLVQNRLLLLGGESSVASLGHGALGEHRRDLFRSLLRGCVVELVLQSQSLLGVQVQLKLHNIRTRARHPESNGIVERFNGTVQRDSDDYYGEHYLAAERIVAQLIHEYNHVRLHASLGYLEPREMHLGNPVQRREERRQKLQTARQHRTTQNRSRVAAQPSSSLQSSAA